MEFLPYLLCGAGILTLITLSIIDLRVWLLPNWLNLVLAVLGVGFHITTSFEILQPQDLVFGALLGSGTLYIIRFFGNMYYKQDTLGLGDVKLLGAAGCWLGPEGVVIAMTLGAFAGLLHGVGVALTRAVKEKTKPNLNRLMIPAGPGFCVGILAACIWKFYPYLMG